MNCTGERCLVQYNKVDPATCTAVPYCPQATPPKTNADRIRSMTDEELANWLTIINSSKPQSAPQWLEWLKQEVR